MLFVFLIVCGSVGIVRVIEFQDLAVVDDQVKARSATRVVFGIEKHLFSVFVGDVLMVIHVDVVAVVGLHVYDFGRMNFVQ